MPMQKGVPVHLTVVMLRRPCCMQVSSDGQFRYANSRWFAAALERLEKSGVHGMAVDVWVGAVPQSCLFIALPSEVSAAVCMLCLAATQQYMMQGYWQLPGPRDCYC